MSLSARLAYLLFNAGRNIADAFVPLRVERWRLPPAEIGRARHRLTSPSRIVSEHALSTVLRDWAPNRPVTIIDIGCGSGGAREMFAAAGLHGTYIGVDIDDRFQADGWPMFESRFVQADAHDAELPMADLIFSFSALEHIPNDGRLIERLRGFVKPGGLQLHILPAGWALAAYLWHGYRQYPRAALRRRFDSSTTRVIAAGGVPSLLLHVFAIAVPEILLRFNLRRRWPKAFGRALAAGLGADRWLPVAPTGYVVVERAT
ncbi:MAG: class I SAM-dependent methyltransferase [Pseudomonadota bacterium]